MIQRLKNSWELVKASGQVLQADKELLLFPVFSGIAMILVVASFLLPLAVAGFATDQGGGFAVLGYVILFLFYFVQYTVIVFFNSALVGAALIRLRGGNPTVGDGISVAMKNLMPILGYALISATVGVLLKMAREKTGWVGRILASLGGLAWTLATYLVVPILVAEDIGPIEAVKRSATILRRTWGEQIAGSVGIGFFFGFLTILYSVIAIPILVITAIGGAPVSLIILIAAVVVLGYLLLALIASALKGVYSAALYQFATTGEASMFDRRMLSGAFRQR